MSNSLLRTSLNLVTGDNFSKSDKKKNQAKSTASTRNNQRNSNKLNKSDLKLHRTKRVTVHEAKKRLLSKKDPTADNLKKLLLLSSNKLDSKTAEQLLCRAVTKRPVVEDKPVVEESTVFTEEDFKNFEAEYLAS